MTAQSAFDLIFRNALLRGAADPMDIGVTRGRITAIEPTLACEAAEVDVGGRLALPGFVDSHIHLDKACLLGRCGHDHGSVSEAIRAVSEMKKGFSVEDVYARGARVLERAIVHGTTRMRTHVEIDPRIGLRGFEAVKALKRDYAWAIDLSLCVFPQEGLTNDPGSEELLIQALRDGGEVIGGCPYTDTDPNAHLARIFDLAEAFDLDVDLHLDFDLDPSWWHLDEVCRQTERRNYGGRVAIGHATKLSALPPERLRAATAQLAKAGVAVTVLPATDLYLMGREATHNAPRGLTLAHKLAADGVLCSIATNNVLNPFTPFGDASLLRMANFYANVAHASVNDFDTCLDLVTELPARLMNLGDYGIKVGNPADLIVLDTQDSRFAVAELPDVVMGFKSCRQTFARQRPTVFRPGS
ncbi:cytosine deaminase [Bradyrhizobium sp. GM2.2]|uniref:amidohydrolase family protein n=1 Tax=unclassified Bradyrhizobium TaxID=2631580 RepID=UPI001FF705D5|nr:MULTISPECIES: amidohydrolase family protein [unclassified Bradyrhizobium]MCK1273094.1 amidohydrolase family protein [Bradyrhizobium sp. 84]MCK1293660.1 amidohydrolase family protein [Bradyrhizobium sp. 30]MCK1314337.1 amidohydrolase family protein [Bradyrhizobium sp. 23]MCK1331645.1 amidohydrolase family protein [Bradyrhizobium sp. CW9]MCK1376562.1 amidohydrolase family protein [Bradyrhizobium sp. 49]